MSNFDPAVVAHMDQDKARVRDIVESIVSHWDDDPCPGYRECLGETADHIPMALAQNPYRVANILQAALFTLALAEHDRRHPDVAR